MFSYRHAYHAGNHADVLKHFIQVQLHHYMNQKDTAYTYIDTHSGAGVYALDSAQAIKSGEYIDGIGRLWGRDDLPPALAEYVELISTLNPSGKLRYYPGSPWVADAMARSQDRLRLFELHRADTKLLMENIRKLEAHKAEQGEHARGRRILADFSDGFLGLKALLPPPSRRALVLIDPPYEVKLDYKHVRDALEDALGRFPGGVYSVWYPVLQRMESRQFPDRLKRLPAKEWLHVTLSVAGPRADGKGLHSSAMFILNPPYTLEPMLRQVLPYLVQVLGQDSGASFHIERGTQQTGAVSRGGLVEAGQRTGTAGTPRQPIGNARRASPLSGAGSLRLPGQPFGDGPRARAGAADAAKPQGDAAKGDSVRSSRPGTPRAPAATGTTMRPGTPARAGGGPDARPDARPTTGAGPRATGAGRTQPMSARGVNTAGGDRPANTSRSASARSSGRTAPGGIKRGGPAKS
jgi:23S rRNA (adenine2030-N6)-methyltransferase